VAEGVAIQSPMRIDILCLFPEMFVSPFNQSIVKRAKEQGLIDIMVHNIRDYTHDRHHTVDDYPYGGGPGMVLKPEPVFEAVAAVKQQLNINEIPIILLTPQGRLLNQRVAGELSLHPHLMLICGHYEGVDERVHSHLATDEISIGVKVMSEKALNILREAGAKVDYGKNHAIIPRNLVEEALRKAPRAIKYCARNPKRDFVLNKGEIHFTTGGSPPCIIDWKTGVLYSGGV